MLHLSGLCPRRDQVIQIDRQWLTTELSRWAVRRRQIPPRATDNHTIKIHEIALSPYSRVRKRTLPSSAMQQLPALPQKLVIRRHSSASQECRGQTHDDQSAIMDIRYLNTSIRRLRPTSAAMAPPAPGRTPTAQFRPPLQEQDRVVKGLLGELMSRARLSGERPPPRCFDPGSATPVVHRRCFCASPLRSACGCVARNIVNFLACNRDFITAGRPRPLSSPPCIEPHRRAPPGTRSWAGPHRSR